MIKEPMSKPKTDLADPLPILPLTEIITQGLLCLSFIFDAAIPIIPSWKSLPWTNMIGSLLNFVRSFIIFN